MRNLTVSLLLLFATLSCALGPDYRRPAIDFPASWRVQEDQAKDVANTAWWEQFDDAALNDLVRAGLEGNKDLRITSARVEEYAGRLRVARSDFFPQASLGGAGSRVRVSDESPLWSPTFKNPYSDYQLFGSASWEIDIWGRIRRANEAARAELMGTEEGRRAVILTLVTSVASGYIELRHLDKHLDIAKSTAQSREESYELSKLRLERGLISELELRQIQSEYQAALATIPRIEKSIAQQENALSVLLGRNPGPIVRGKSLDELTMPAVPQGMPSLLLERRPDIRQAEQDLIAANARIGVAKAAYFPAISLTGSYGVESAELSRLFTGPAKSWSYGLPVFMPIFTAGAVGGRVKAAEAVQQQALFRYQKAIQNAFREVDDSLIGQQKSREELLVEEEHVKSVRVYARLAKARYENGHTSYLEVLDAQRSLFHTELACAQAQGSLFRALVDLYKSMGGGWVVEAARQQTGGRTPGSY